MNEGTSPTRYLIVGGGMAADAAARGIRAEDPEGSILLLTREPDPPYDRPPLSKGLWRGESADRIWRETAALGAEIRTQVSVTRVDPDRGEAWDEAGRSYAFDRLLLATGAYPRTLAGPDPGVIYFRTLQDYRRVRNGVSEGARVGILGGGFIGCELASAFRGMDVDVSMCFPEAAPLGLLLPEPFPDLLASAMTDGGVELHPGTLVRGTRAGSTGMNLVLDEASVRMDVGAEFALVVAGLGVSPNEELARDAGLATDDGIVVDGALRTSHPKVWAAGDVARCHFPFLDRSMRVEHEDHANESGMFAGRAMAGAKVAYDAIPYFYSEAFGFSVEALGEIRPDASEPEVTVPSDPAGPGVAVFRSSGRVRGVLLWNLRGRAVRLRKLLRSSPNPSSAEILTSLGL